MPKKLLLFAPCAFNLAETSRMVEIAKGIARHPASESSSSISISSPTAATLSGMIEKHGFALTRMEPRLTQRKDRVYRQSGPWRKVCAGLH